MDTAMLPAPRLTRDTPPTLTGRMGNAWRIDSDMVARRRGMEDDPRKAVSLHQWLAYAPYAHPIWHTYLIVSFALRDAAGVPAATKLLPDATHEVVVMALDPDHETYVDDFPKLLTPANFAGQFIEPDDDAANERIKRCVQDVIDGVLNPDTDYMQWWIRRFSASNIKGDPAEAGKTVIRVADADGNATELVIPPQPAPND